MATSIVCNLFGYAVKIMNKLDILLYLHHVYTFVFTPFILMVGFSVWCFMKKIQLLPLVCLSVQGRVTGWKWFGWIQQQMKHSYGRGCCSLMVNGWRMFYLWECLSWQKAYQSEIVYKVLINLLKPYTLGAQCMYICFDLHVYFERKQQPLWAMCMYLYNWWSMYSKLTHKLL